jgi:hypothetical protein
MALFSSNRRDAVPGSIGLQLDRASISSVACFLATRFAITTIFLLLMAWGAGLYLEKTRGDQPLHQRVIGVKLDPAKYDILFVGDSRTYCGIHPEYLDPLLGTRSINLASFAHWFPTQFAMIRDLGPSLSGRTVVWTIGHQNFTAINIQPVYPVKIGHAVDIVRMGLNMTGLANSLLQSYTLTRGVAEKTQLLGDLQSLLQIPAPPAKVEPRKGNTPAVGAFVSTVSQDKAQQSATNLGRALKHDPTVASFSPVYDSGAVTSVVIYHHAGGYERVEIDQDYFRWQQKRITPKPMTNEAAAHYVFEADHRMLKLFDVMLDEFKRSGAKLIVNEIEEAGFMYAHPKIRAAARLFMQTEIRRRVEAAGFTYVRADLDRLEDADFFDYNHLNSRGIAKYSPMLAELLKPSLAH